MKNSWLQLPEEFSFVLPCDTELVGVFNNNVQHRMSNICIQKLKKAKHIF